MISLAEFQTALARALLGDGDGPLAPWLKADARAGLAVYRGTLISGYLEALGDVYPVLRRLVGEACFAQAARAYIGGHLSTSGDLHAYGEDFPACLAGYPPVAGLAYLPDVARLEWAVHQVFHAADPGPADLERLAALLGPDCASRGLVLSPACRLLASPYPVHRLWGMHQPGAAWDDGFRLDSGEARLLVRRNAAFEIECVPLAETEHALLSALADGLGLGEAFDRAGGGAVELAVHLQRHLQAGTLMPSPFPSS